MSTSPRGGDPSHMDGLLICIEYQGEVFFPSHGLTNVVGRNGLVTYEGLPSLLQWLVDRQYCRSLDASKDEWGKGFFYLWLAFHTLKKLKRCKERAGIAFTEGSLKMNKKGIACYWRQQKEIEEGRVPIHHDSPILQSSLPHPLSSPLPSRPSLNSYSLPTTVI